MIRRVAVVLAIASLMVVGIGPVERAQACVGSSLCGEDGPETMVALAEDPLVGGAAETSDTVAAGQVTSDVAGLLVQRIADTIGGLVATAVGLSAQSMTVSPGVTGLPTPASQPGWVGGRNVYRQTSPWLREASWSVGSDPAEPASGDTIPVTAKFDVCAPGSTATGSAYLGLTVYYGGSSGTVFGSQIGYSYSTCGTVHQAAIDVPVELGGKLLTRIEALDQGYATCGYGSAYPCLTWYPKWSADRPVDVPAGQGTMDRTVGCQDKNGAVTQVTSSWSGDVTVSGTYSLPEVECPDGTVVAWFTMTWTPADGSSTTTVVPTTQTPPWVTNLPKDYPDCVNGGCTLSLWDITGADLQSCGNLAVDCPYWYVDPARDTDYQCQWGNYVVDLSVCSMFRDPGIIRFNAHLKDGQSTFDKFPPLELDSGVVTKLVSGLTDRYPDDQQKACEVFGEAVRATRGPAPVIVPDVVWDCATYDLTDALYFIAATGESLGQQVAVDALTKAVHDWTPAATYPDCDQLSSGGVCTDPPPLTVSAGAQTWATGPKIWTSPTPAQVTTTMDTCTSLVQAADSALSAAQARDKCESQPIFVPGGKAGWGKEAARHDADIITPHPELIELQYISRTNKNVAVPYDWYRPSDVYLAPCTDRAGTKVGQGKECDEYPYYSSVEGGSVAYDAYGQDVLRAINFADNRREGGALGVMYRDARCDMTSATVNSKGTVLSPGTQYLVVPLPNVDVPSFYLCPQG